MAFGVTNHTSRLIIRNGNIRPRLYCRPCCLIAGEFKTEWFPMSQTIFLYWQLCLGEIKTGRNCLQVEKNEKQPSIYSLRPTEIHERQQMFCVFVCVCNKSRFINKTLYMHINAYFTQNRVNPCSHMCIDRTRK